MSVKLVSAGAVTVTTAGTRVALSATPIANVVKIYLTNPAANTGLIYIGDSTVASTNGIQIVKGATIEISSPKEDMLDLQLMYADSATNGDKVIVNYLMKMSR
jgi:hypothetical protein